MIEKSLLPSTLLPSFNIHYESQGARDDAFEWEIRLVQIVCKSQLLGTQPAPEEREMMPCGFFCVNDEMSLKCGFVWILDVLRR